MKDKINRFGILCEKPMLTQQEHKEFKKLEREITTAMSDEVVFFEYIELFKEAVKPLMK